MADLEKYSTKWKLLNPDMNLHLYDDEKCIQFFKDNYPPLFLEIFLFISHGPIKADFWRVCILYKYGGVYCDIDTEPLIPLSKFIEPNVSFVICSAYRRDLLFNPNFIVTPKNSIIIKDVIDWYVKKYNNNEPYDYWSWSIMQAFTDTFLIPNYKNKEGIYYYKKMKIQVITEVPGNNHADAHNIYKGMRVFNNRYKDWDPINHCFLQDEKDEKDEKVENI
jgi:mannosyltransferase OCH1-like enzyme